MEVANFTYTRDDVTVYAYLTNNGISSLFLPSHMEPLPESVAPTDSPVAEKLYRALERYFSGVPESFAGLPLDLLRHTEFRRGVWECARKVKWGMTTSYGGLCTMMGRGMGTARAVGQALGANPVPIIVPCHRILAGNGSLCGFACGLDWKMRLLRIEGFYS
jgi:methylated-DNA-[protein]-cysteine S-methyltransferase